MHIVTYFNNGETIEDTNQSLIKCQRGEAQWLHLCKTLRSMEGLKELRIRFFMSSLASLWESKLLETLVGIRIQEGKFVVELPTVVDQSFAINDNAQFIIQRRTREDDRSNVVYAPAYDPDPLSWQQLIVLMVCNPVATLQALVSISYECVLIFCGLIMYLYNLGAAKLTLVRVRITNGSRD